MTTTQYAKDVYAAAQANGYTGTLEAWLNAQYATCMAANDTMKLPRVSFAAWLRNFF